MLSYSYSNIKPCKCIDSNISKIQVNNKIKSLVNYYIICIVNLVLMDNLLINYKD